MEAAGGRRRRRKRRRTWLARNTTVLHRSLVAYIRRAGDEFPRSTHDWPVMRQEFPTFSGGYRCSSCRTLPGHSTTPAYIPSNASDLFLSAIACRAFLTIALLRFASIYEVRREKYSKSPLRRSEKWRLEEVSVVSNERHFGAWNFWTNLVECNRLDIFLAYVCLLSMRCSRELEYFTSSYAISFKIVFPLVRMRSQLDLH